MLATSIERAISKAKRLHSRATQEGDIAAIAAIYDYAETEMAGIKQAAHSLMRGEYSPTEVTKIIGIVEKWTQANGGLDYFIKNRKASTWQTNMFDSFVLDTPYLLPEHADGNITWRQAWGAFHTEMLKRAGLTYLKGDTSPNGCEQKKHAPVIYYVGDEGEKENYIYQYAPQIGRVTGKRSRIPSVGDLLYTPLPNGRMGVFRFTSVHRESLTEKTFSAQAEMIKRVPR